jgi:hypothetical protein
MPELARPQARTDRRSQRPEVSPLFTDHLQGT